MEDREAVLFCSVEGVSKMLTRSIHTCERKLGWWIDRQDHQYVWSPSVKYDVDGIVSLLGVVFSVRVELLDYMLMLGFFGQQLNASPLIRCSVYSLSLSLSLSLFSSSLSFFFKKKRNQVHFYCCLYFFLFLSSQ
ncbi:hypothetical protein GE21DRAFT_1129668 [Neurospora crassa]|nr:hypothetical protein GE21DRAFT_1129668 [Neurospora crassa]